MKDVNLEKRHREGRSMVRYRSSSLIVAFWAILLLPLTAWGVALEPARTGQTKCYSPLGQEIPCEATGQDADAGAGLTWPEPRFLSGAGAEADCVTDALTGMMWAKKPDSVGRLWIDAVTYSNGLTLCGHNDWRLPNVNELESLTNAGEPDNLSWLRSGGFEGLRPGAYWTSTTYPGKKGHSWAVAVYRGYVFTDHKILAHYFVLPVRRTTLAVPKTGQTVSYAVGDDGDLLRQEGSPWPAPRFVGGNGSESGCVTDSTTGLVWMKNPDGNVRNWQDALAYAKGLDLCGHTDWRIPGRKELRSLVNYGESDSAAWMGAKAFGKVLPDGYWSSTTDVHETGNAWFVNLESGVLGSGNKGNHKAYALAVRGGLPVKK